jgi:hypothetical protein
MTAPLILIVSGSRTLATRPGGEAWARRQIVEATTHLDPTERLIVTGDAPGPDAWAIEIARNFGLAWHSYRKDGTIRDHAGMWGRWCSIAQLDPDPYRRPLQRNKAMVDAFAAGGVLVLGLVDPASRTHGTDHTLTAARKEGLRVERRVCP